MNIPVLVSYLLGIAVGAVVGLQYPTHNSKWYCKKKFSGEYHHTVSHVFPNSNDVLITDYCYVKGEDEDLSEYKTFNEGETK